MTVDGHCADSGRVLLENIRVSSSNTPHPVGSAGAGDALVDMGFEVTASIQSGRPSVSGLASFGGALHRSMSGLCQLAEDHSA